MGMSAMLQAADTVQHRPRSSADGEQEGGIGSQMVKNRPEYIAGHATANVSAQDRDVVVIRARLTAAK